LGNRFKKEGTSAILEKELRNENPKKTGGRLVGREKPKEKRTLKRGEKCPRERNVGTYEARAMSKE